MKEVVEIFFISKKDTFYSVAIWGTIALLFFAVFPTTFPLKISDFVGIGIGVIIISFLIWAWFGTGYHIEHNVLQIRNGPFKMTVDIREIKNITKEKSVWAAAALSMDRLVIQYGNCNPYDNKDVHVSPKKEHEFIELLLSKNPQIKIDDTLSEIYKI